MLLALGIPWYTRESYARILDIMEDAQLLPRSYDEWRKQAESVERHQQAAGRVVIRAVIDPDEFPDWCRSRGLNVDAKARMQFASLAARAGTRTAH